jgi:hypothetical protein
MIRGYDTSALHWKDEILRIRHMEAEITALQKEMEEIKRDLENPGPRWWWVHIDADGRTEVVCEKR